MHRRHDRGEIVIEEHHLRGFFGRLGALVAHGDADIGLLEGRRIVDAVAGHRNDTALRLQRLHDAQLVLRTGPREHGRRIDRLLEFRVRQLVDIGAREDARRLAEPQLSRNGFGGRGMIARDHLDGDAGCLALRDGCHSLVARRIDETDNAEENEPVLDVAHRKPCRIVRRGLHRKAEHALSLSGCGSDL